MKLRNQSCQLILGHYKLKNADEIEDYVQNYQKYGLKRIESVK